MKLLRSIVINLQNWVDQQNLHYANIRRKKILEFFLWIIAFSAIVGGYILLFSPTGRITSPMDLKLTFWTIVLTLVGVIVLATLNRIGVGWLARLLFVLLFLLMAAFSYTPEQAVNGRGVLIFTIPIVTSSILLTSWSSFIVAALSSMVTAVFALDQGVPPNFINMLSFFVLALLIWFSVFSLERALENLRDSNQALKDSEERYSLATTTAKTNIWELNIRTGEVYTDAHSGMFGYSDEEYPKDAEAWQALVHPDDLQHHLEALQDHIDGKTPNFSSEHRAFQKDGSIRWLLTIGKVQRDERGDPVKVIGASTDITERKQVEDELRQSEIIFRAITEQSGEGIALAKSDGYYIAVNPAFCRMTGYSEAELLKMKAFDLLLPETEQILFSKVKAGQRGQREVVLKKKDSTTFVAEIRGYPVTLEGQGCILGITRDITERRQAEERERAQRDLAEALSDSAAALNSTLDFDDVLDRILENVGRVVPHDAVDIFLLDADGLSARIVGHHNNRSQLTEARGMRFLMSQTRNLRDMQTTGTPVIITDTNEYEGWVVTPLSAWICSNLGVPIMVKDRIIGFLVLSSGTPNTFTQMDAERLQAFADHAAIAIENARLYEEVQSLAVTDAMTGIYNRSFFETELERMERGRDFPISIIVADLDNLKTVNDKFGHTTGDELIKSVAQILRDTFRAGDIIARIGGDEFGVLLPDTNSVETEQMLLRVRSKLADHNIAHPDLSIKLSIGASTAEKDGLMEAFTVADQRMYADKVARKSLK